MNRHIHFFLIASLCAVCFSVPLTAQDTPENAEFKLAVDLYNDGLYDLAEDQFKVFIEKFPNTSSSIEARYYLGLIQMDLGKYNDAQQTFKDVALRYPESNRAPEAWLKVGEAFEKMRNYGEAASAYSRLKTFYPKHAKAAQSLVRASENFLKAGDIDNAKLNLNAVLLEYPQSNAVQEANFGLGKIYITEGDYQRAKREFTRLVNDPDATAEMKVRSTVALGEIENSLGNPSNAKAKFEEAIALYPQTQGVYEAHIRLGDVLRQDRDFSAAVQSYTKVINGTNVPDELRQEAYRGAAECAAAGGDYARAVDQYELLFDKMKQGTIAPSIYKSAAQAARNAGEYSLASRYLETLLRDTLIVVDRRDVLVELAENASESGSPADAAQWYRMYTERYPNDVGAPYALYELAEVYREKLSSPTQASDLYSRIVEQYSGSSVADDALFRKAQVLEETGSTALALESYSRLVAQYPASPHVEEAASLADRIERYSPVSNDESIQRIALALGSVNANPGSADANHLIGTLYLFDLKKYDKALQLLRSASGVSPEYAEENSYGIAIATAMLARKGEAGVPEAVTALEAYTRQYPAGEYKEAAAYELFLLQIDRASAATKLDAAEAYLLSSAAEHKVEAQLAKADALAELGRSAEAGTLYESIIAGSGESTLRAEAYYGRAMNASSSGDYEQAIRDLREYVNRAGSGRHAADAYMELGRLALRTGKYADAVEAFQSLVRRHGYSERIGDANTMLVQALMESGDADKAVLESRRMWQAAENNPFEEDGDRDEYMFLHAQTLAAARDASGAKRVLLEYSQRFPNGNHISEVYFALGQMYRDEGKVGIATTYLQRASAQGTHAQAGRDAADLHLESGNYPAAIRAYEQLAAQEETNLGRTYALSRIVVALYRADSLNEAQRRAADFREQFPDAEPIFEEFMLEHGKHFYRAKKYDQARDYFEEIEDSDSKEIASLANHWIARTFVERNRNEDAKEKFQDVVDDYPGTEGAVLSLLSLGRMSLRAEDYTNAALQFKRVVDIPDLTDAMLKEALNGLIKSYDFLGQPDAAAEMVKRFLEAYPNDPSAFRKKIELGIYYYQLRYFDQSIAHLESLLSEASPDDQAEIRYYIADNYFYKGDFRQAALEYLKVPYLVTQKTSLDWASSAYAGAAKSYEELGRYSTALEMYQKIVNTPNADPRARGLAQQNIDRLKKLID
ncbi:MAG: hypothetical protein CL946_06850 [Ectothiorhodospiraceae bacterium]|nr:hypothetical protein [Ectothiorhodospiraceae bacterium]